MAQHLSLSGSRFARCSTRTQHEGGTLGDVRYNLTPGLRARLEARGLDPDETYASLMQLAARMQAEIRAGTFTPTARRADRPKPSSPRRIREALFARGYPLAVVLTEWQHKHLKRP